MHMFLPAWLIWTNDKAHFLFHTLCTADLSREREKEVKYVSKGRNCSSALMTMFCNVHYDGFFPAKQEVANTSPNCHGNTEVAIVSHEDQH